MDLTANHTATVIAAAGKPAVSARLSRAAVCAGETKSAFGRSNGGNSALVGRHLR